MRTTLHDLRRLHDERQPIVMLTCYEASFARVLEAAGIDVLLVGDSLGMVVQGHDSPNPVTLDDMVYHVQAVARGSQRALILADLPFGSSQVSPQETFRNAAELIRAGAQVVKLEGGVDMAETIRFLVSRGIPVCAHIGMTPQSHHQYGGFRVQGRDEAGARRVLADAAAVAEAGASLLLMECIPRVLAEQVVAQAILPTIGIGASPACSGQVLVLHDILGLGRVPLPRLAQDFSAAAGGIRASVEAYAAAVRARTFPGDANCY